MQLSIFNNHNTYHKALYALLVLVILIPPFFFDAPSRKFNTQVALLELLFILFFIPYAYLVKLKPPAISRTTIMLLLTFVGLITISTVFAIDSYWGWRRGVSTLVHVMFFFAVYLFITTEEKKADYLFYIVPLGFVLVSIPMIINILSIEDPANHCWWSCFDKTIGFYSHIRHTNYHNYAAIVFLFALFTTPARIKVRYAIVLLPVLFLFLSILIWSGGRGVVLALLASMFFVLLFTRKKIKVVKLFSVLIFLSVLSVVTLKGIGHDYLISRASDTVSDVINLVISPASDTRVTDTQSIDEGEAPVSVPVESQVTDSPDVETQAPTANADSMLHNLNVISSDRLGLWQGAYIALNQEDKWMFGLGPEGYRSIKPRLQGTQPHNFLLQFIIEWGVLGAAVFTWLLAKTVWYALKQLSREKDPVEYEKRVVSVSFIAGMFVFGMYDGVFYHAIPVLIFCIALAYAVSPNKQIQGS